MMYPKFSTSFGFSLFVLSSLRTSFFCYDNENKGGSLLKLFLSSFTPIVPAPIHDHEARQAIRLQGRQVQVLGGEAGRQEGQEGQQRGRG